MRIRTFIASSLVLASVVVGCEDPAADKPKAVVSTAEPVVSAAPAPASSGSAMAAAPGSGAASGAPASPAAEGDKLTFDNTTGSSVGFVGSKVTGKHVGKFEKFHGTVELAGGKIEGGKVVVDIDTNSAKTDQDGLDKHLLKPEFFDVEKFPKATFTSTEIKAGGEKGATHTVTGTLDLRGAKKTVSFPATIAVGDDAVTAKSEFSINRKDFGMAFEGKKDDLIRDDVLIQLDLKAPRKK